MPRENKVAKRATNSSNGANPGYEAELWRVTNALRGSMDTTEYKYVVLGLIFLRVHL